MAIYRVTASGQLYGIEKWANVFHVSVIGTLNEASVFTCFETFYGNATTGILFLCTGQISGNPPGVNLTQLAIQPVVNPTPPITKTVSYIGGQNVQGGLPVDVSLCISWRTTLAGRSYRGRTYLPPFHSNRGTDGVSVMPAPTTATVTFVKTAAAKLINDCVTASCPLYVYSRKLHDGTAITNGYVDNAWDTQRRRSKSQPTTRTMLLP
jgi:hypothetical protein